MNIEIETSNLKKYIRISDIYGSSKNDLAKAQEEKQFIDYELKMITNNQIEHMITPRVRGINGDPVLYYDVSSKLCLKDVSERCEFKYKELVQIIRTLVSTINNIYEYLLTVENISLDCEHVFLDTNSGEVYFIYLPGKNAELYKAFESFSEFLLMTTDHDDDKAVDIVYTFYAMIQEKNLCFESLISYEDSIKSNEQNDKQNDKQYCKQEIKELYDTRELGTKELKPDVGNTSGTYRENKRRIRPLSLVCMLLFFVSVASGALLYVLNGRIFRSIFSNNIVISISSVYLSIILYIPLSDVLQVITHNIRE